MHGARDRRVALYRHACTHVPCTIQAAHTTPTPRQDVRHGHGCLFRVNRWAHSISLAFPGRPFIVKHATDGCYSFDIVTGLPRDTHLPHRALARGWRIYDFWSKNRRGINQSRISTMVAASEPAACNADTSRWRRELRFYLISSFTNSLHSSVHNHTFYLTYIILFDEFLLLLFFHINDQHT